MSRETVVRSSLLAGGFAAVVAAAALYFAAAGALADAYLYFWSYNVEHYTRVVTIAERLANLDPFAHGRHYLSANPLLLAAVVIQTLAAVWALAVRRRVDGRLLVVLWFCFAYLGASYSGRNFGHYFIQILPAACLLAAWTLRQAWQALAPEKPGWRFLRDLAPASRGLLAAAVALALILPVHRFGRDIAWFNVWQSPPVDEVRRDLLAAIERRSQPGGHDLRLGLLPGALRPLRPPAGDPLQQHQLPDRHAAVGEPPAGGRHLGAHRPRLLGDPDGGARGLPPAADRRHRGGQPPLLPQVPDREVPAPRALPRGPLPAGGDDQRPPGAAGLRRLGAAARRIAWEQRTLRSGEAASRPSCG